MANAATAKFSIEIMPDDMTIDLKNLQHVRNCGLNEYWHWKKATLTLGTQALLAGNLVQGLNEASDAAQNQIDANDLCLFLYISNTGTEDIYIGIDGQSLINPATDTDLFRINAGDAWFGSTNNTPYENVRAYAAGAANLELAAIIKKVA
mgnify:CR=1 FL=1|tara:strand:- start:306 stop:755 length:450 start_codon:yes stop_codon:yes gene_type:complete